MDPYRVLERGGGADLAEEAGVLRLAAHRSTQLLPDLGISRSPCTAAT
jgi:hypothetical protein